MNNHKVNYSQTAEDVFYTKIYPFYVDDFLFGSNYEKFANKISEKFKLNSKQWEYILQHWEEKESILKDTYVEIISSFDFPAENEV